MKSIPHGDQSCGILSNLERVSRFATPFWRSGSSNRIEFGRFTGLTGGRAYRTEYRTEAAWSVICEEMPGCRETRHPGIFAMCFYPTVPIIHFPSPAFRLCVYTVRLHDVKQEACHGLQRLCENTELPDIVSQLTALAKMSM